MEDILRKFELTILVVLVFMMGIVVFLSTLEYNFISTLRNRS